MKCFFSLVSLWGLMGSLLYAGEYAAAVASKAQEGEGKLAVKGAQESWWVLSKELTHLTKTVEAEWWSKDTTTQAALAEMGRYHEELKSLGVDLHIALVPAKARVESQACLGVSPDAVPVQSGLFTAMREKGLSVLDLEEKFGEWRKAEAGVKIYSAQDSHWSPKACQKVAQWMMEDFGLMKTEAGLKFTQVEKKLSLHGDLLSDDEKSAADQEVLPAVYCYQEGSEEGLAPAKDGQVMLLGDSHTLVYHSGAGQGMHTEHAGLLAHLQALLGSAVDLEANRGSGGDAARVGVARRSKSEPALWEGKKAVVWCFSIRELTEGKWRKVPAQL